MPFSDKFWIEQFKKAGVLPAEREGIITETLQSAGNTALQVGKGIGSTIEETTGDPSMRQYFQEKEAANPQWRPDPNYSPSSLHPADIARTVSTGVTQSAISLGAGVVGGMVGGAPGAIAATTAGMFSQTYGERVKEYREAMPGADEGVIKGWAFLSSLGESLIETVAGPEQMVAGAFKGIVRQALNQTTRQLIKMIGKEAAKAAIAEGSEEVCQMYWDNVVRLAAGQNVELQPFSEVRDTFMGGALPGAFMGGVGGGIQAMQSRGSQVGANTSTVIDPAAPAQEKQMDPALQVVQGLSEQLKVPIRFMTEAEVQQNAKTDENGNPVSVNGYYDTGKSEIVLNPNGELSVEQAFGHELKHFLNVHHPDLIEAFDSMAQQNLTEKGQQELADTGALYGEVGNATEEFNADWFARLAMDPEALREAAIMAESRSAGFGKKLIDAVTEFLKMVMDTARKIGTPQMEAVFNNAKEVRSEAIRALSDFNQRQNSQLVKVEQAPAETKQLPGRPERKLLPAGKPADERTEEEQARQKKLLEAAQYRSDLEQRIKERQEREKVYKETLRHEAAMRKIDKHLAKFNKFGSDAMDDEAFRRANTEELDRIEAAIRKGNPQLVREGLDRLAKRVKGWKRKGKRVSISTKTETESGSKAETNRNQTETESGSKPVSISTKSGNKAETKRKEIIPDKKLVFIQPEQDKQTEKPAPPVSEAEKRKSSIVPEKKLPFVAPQAEPVETPVEAASPQVEASPGGVVRVNTNEIHVDPKRFQFKSGTNPVTGVDESNKVGGEWDPKSAGLVYVWEDKEGKKFIVNGHHRLQLAKELNVPMLNAIVDREVDGVSQEEARRQGVLTNIRDGQGRVEDYATFVRGDKSMDEAAARKEGITSRAAGQQGFMIGRYAGEELYGAFKAGDITGAKAAAIADAGKDDPATQIAGMKKAKEMSAEQLREFLKILKRQQREQKLDQLDLFGFDDSAIKMSEDISKLAIKKLKAIRDRVLTVQRAVRKPDVAQQGDVKVGGNAQKLYEEALQEQARWEHYETDHELYQQLVEEAGYGQKEEAPAPAQATQVEPKQESEKASAPAKPINPDNPLGLDNFDDMFNLFSESEEDKRRAAQEKAKAEAKEAKRKQLNLNAKTPPLDMGEKPQQGAEPSPKTEYKVSIRADGSVSIERFIQMPNGVPVFDANGKIEAKNGQEALDVVLNNKLPIADRDLQRLQTIAGVSKPEEKAWGSENKVVSTEQYEAAKKRMLERMKRLNVGFDPGILSDGAMMASYHVEAGARKFTDFAKRMMDDLGEGIKPYLKSIYESARRMPGMEDVAKDMDSTQSVDDFSFDDPKEETKDLASSLREIIDMQVSAGAKQQRLMRLASQFNISEKEIQERCEAEVVAMAREINAENISDEEKYRKMVELYDRQPNFSKRTSTSIANQAYSTPVPLAWLVGKRVGLAGKSTYEPTAGTGMLTIAGTPEFTTVNEIDDLRRDILSKQGFQSVTNNDAVKEHPKMIFDRMVMNPPFGGADPKTYGGYKLSKIDHIIAAEALSALNSKGRAAIIIGANTEGYDGDGRASFADHVFMSYLYDNFNVKDNYIISGDLYRKQGASYPVRVLTLSGRRSKTAEIIDHPTDIEVIKNWDTLYQRMKGDVENGQLSETGGSNSMDGAGQRADQQGQNAGNGGRRSGGDGETLGAGSVAPGENTGRPEILGAGNEQQLRGSRGFGANQPKKPIVPGSTESDGGIGTGLGTRTEPLPLSSEHGTDTTDNQADTGEPGNERSGLSVPDGRKLDGYPASTEGGLVGEERGELNNAYIAGSQSTDKMDVVTPRYMAKAVSDSLANLKNKVGDIDAFVQQELGYESKEDLYDALADVQIDGVALAIDAIRNHNGFVLGDQTGIGKGRQCAAIIRWAQKHDVMPVFITADQNLFTDMYRDGNDIGSVFKPLIMASDSAKAQIADANGNVIVSLPRNQESAFQSMLGDNSEYDVVFTSYSQLAKPSGRQQNFLRGLASDRRCLFVMDEAHKASGESNVGMFFAAEDGILNSPNVDVLYASATFAKRPDNMSLYFRTNINKAVENQSSLTGVLARGGVPLQQILSSGLAQDGQYVRRERDFTGVNFEMRIAEPVDEKTGQIDKTALADLVTTYDRVAGVLEALVAHSELVRNVVTNAVRAQYGQANTREKTSVGMSTFASVVHNFVAQLLLASKCNICVQQAAMAFKEGKKPVIALTNTLESSLKEYIESEGISVGDPLSMKYSHILENAVYRMYRYTEKDRTGQAIRHEFAPEDFGLGEAHERMIRAIHDLDDIDLPISPIDYLKDQLERRGIRTGEITGRGYTVDYSGEIPVLSRRESEAKDKNKIVNGFNSGKIDAVILNASGSTGLSIHAAAWFADKRPRHMILVQPSLDIAIVIQTLGRIMRTGQVVKPSYVFLPSPLNAERRPFAVLAKKMQSLNANTTANNKSNISFDEDFINKYGDMVAQQFLNENAEIASRIGLDADTTDGDTPESNIMTRLTGRMALLDNATQGEIYDDLLARYTSLIELQKAIGEYDLEISAHDDWDVISGEETELASGDANGSIFTSPVKMKRISLSEKYSVRSAKEIREKIKENLGETRGEVVNRINNDLAHVEKAIENLEGAYKPGTKTKEFINDRKRFSREAFSHFTEFIINNAGEVLELSIGEENFSAAITGYRIVGKANPRSPFIPSRVMIDFAIAGKLGKLTIPFSRFRTQEVTYSRSMYDIDYYFTGKKVDTRSNRYAITGNIMRGLEYAEAGKVVSYKTNDGKVESALLLPKAWNPSKLVRDPQNEIHGVDEAIDFLKNNDQGIKTADGLLRIYKYYDYFVLESPMTGRNRGKYAQDRDGLLKITGDFISRNRKMRTESLDEKTTRRAIGYLLNRKDVILAKEREANDTSLLPKSSAEDETAEANASGTRYYSLVRNPKTIKRLENEKHIKAYRAAQVGPDGKLYSPMAGMIGKEWGPEIVLGEWEQADERPWLAKPKTGKNGNVTYEFTLNKGNGTSITAAYNPYIHSSRSPLNDQFASAYKRPNLVTLEVLVPESELTSGYKAQKAKDAVGELSWKTGPVARHLQGDDERKVILSRWDKPLRIVPESEVAKKVASLLQSKNIAVPENVVTPKLRDELEKLGVPIERKYSLSQHRQVNPIMLDGEVRDEYRSWLENGRYTPEQVAEWYDKALAWVGRQGGPLKAAQEFAEGAAPAGKIGTMAAKLIMNSQEFAGFDLPLRKAVADQYIFQGSEWGREGVARRLASLTLDTLEKAQVFFDRLTAKMEKGDRDRLRDDVEERTGIDIDNLPNDIVNDPAKLDEVLRAALASSAAMKNKVREYWINAILSGPQTHAANMIGNFANAVYELGPKRLAEVVINLAAKRKTGATIGEFKAMTAAFNWKAAWEKAKIAFDQEVLSDAGKVEGPGVAIEGKHGRVIRVPGRLLRAADEFAKAIVAPVEAAAYAYREAKEKNLSEEETRNYIERQIAKADSLANLVGTRRATELTFQEDPGAAVQHLISLREKGGMIGTTLQYFLPFIKTPTNLLRQGVRKSPLGAVNLAGETIKLLQGKRQLDNDYIGLAAEQLLAWGAVAIFLGMDDDDDRPILTGTGAGQSLNERSFKAGKIPSYSIRVGDQYISYRRIEPLASGLALIADGMTAYRDTRNGKTMTAAIKDMLQGATMIITEKSYLNSLDQLHQFLTDPERGIEQWGTSFLASWIPNVSRQTINTLDNNLRDYRSRARGGDWWKEQFFHAAGKAGFVRVSPRIDYFGREVTKSDAENASPGADLWKLISPVAIKPAADMEKADLLLWNYNRSNPDKAYWPGLPNYTFERGRERYYFAGEDYTDFAAESGKLAHKQINFAIRRGLLNVNKPTDKDIDLIKRIFTRARKETRDKFIAKKRFDRASSE